MLLLDDKIKSFFLFIGIVIFVILGGVVFAWDKWAHKLLYNDKHQLPTIRAPKTPIKVRPQSPGGIEIPDQDKLVYDRLEKQPPSGKIEVLLPPPEKPLTPPTSKTIIIDSKIDRIYIVYSW